VTEPTKITPEAVDAALARAGAVLAAKTGTVTPEALADAVAAWSWLGLLRDNFAAELVQARATGAAWDTIARVLALTPAGAERRHARALKAIADRLNAALPP
jgi:hypothetical protein